MRLRTKLIALAATAGIALSATAAYAYWTTSGSGSGSAAAATANGSLSLKATFNPGLYPGMTAEDVVFSAKNTGSTAVGVGTISVDSVSIDPDHSGCDPDWFDFTSPASPFDVSIAADTNWHALDATNKGSIRMLNDAGNQDACKGATVTLNLSGAAL